MLTPQVLKWEEGPNSSWVLVHTKTSRKYASVKPVGGVFALFSCGQTRACDRFPVAIEAAETRIVSYGQHGLLNWTDGNVKFDRTALPKTKRGTPNEAKKH